jgi:hypothetical protein
MDQRAPTSKLQWLLAAAGIVMLAAALWIVLGRRERAASVSAMPSRPASERVSLYVQHDGPELRLHWNADSDAVRRAGSGALLITDGPRQSRLDLSPAELRAGAASYWPEAQGVEFKLELDGAVAGELQAPALAVRQAPEEPRPSPFDAAPKRKAKRRALVEEPDDDMPKPRTVRTSEADRSEPVHPAPAPKPRTVRTAEADRRAEPVEPAPERKPSKWKRVTGKIPLLRRLGQN